MAASAPFAGRMPKLRGRSDECQLLDSLVSAVRAGESRTLVISGEAGVGKTALLEHLIMQASELTILRAVGVESEVELGFASLHQMCLPLMSQIDRLPDPQRNALEVVFGVSEGSAPDPFLVGLATLSLLCEAAESTPLLCVVDDAQWLDRASARTLAFVGRRLLAERVGLLFAAREPGPELRGLPELEIRGLGAQDANALLRSAVQFLLDAGVRDRIIAETRGNPLALLELPRGLTATQLAGGFGLLGDQRLTGRIETSFERRLQALPVDSRRLLLLAAAEPVGDPLLLWRAADGTGVTTAAAAAAEAEGLIRIDRHVAFRHPLVRSAVYRSAPVHERRVAHLALAAATDRETDPDRRAWHLAAAAAAPDEEVARELERCAGRAQARGGLAAAAAFLDRSVALSIDTAQRSARALAAADASLRAGDFDTSYGLLATSEAGDLNEVQRATLDLLRAQLAFSQQRGSDAPALLLRAAKSLEPFDRDLARETYLDAWSAALFAGRFAAAGDLYEVSRAARAAPAREGVERACDLLLDGFSTLLTDGRAAAVPILQQAAGGFAGDRASTEEVLRWGWLATIAAVVVWDYDSCLAVATRGVRLARECGALTVLAVALNIEAQALAMRGDFSEAAQCLSEAEGVIEATGTQVLQYGALYLAAYEGRVAEVASIAEATVRAATAGGQGNAIGFAEVARAMIANGGAMYQQAVAPSRETSEDMPELVVSMWALVELVEAAARSGEMDLARSAVARLAARNDASANDWSRGIEARSRAMVCDGSDAEDHYREAIERLGRTPLRPELGRSHLVYGEWLRRQNRRSDARAQLRIAHEMLTDLGMALFAERARIELLATGEKVRKRTPDTRDDLTAQERQIAILARDGLSNPEIGGRLFLSRRTVEWHLGKVFGKLGIRSRRELAGALARVDPEPP